jgi:hypothetical protein
MRRARFSFVMAVAALCVSLALSGVEEGVDAGSFVRDGAGARALGMGGAFVSLADDLSTTLWNPAGLARIEGLSVGGMYTNKFGLDIDFQSLGATARVSAFGVGLTMVRSSTEIPITDGGDSGGGFFSWTNTLWLGSVAYDVGAAFLDLSQGPVSGLLVGGNLKYYYESALEGRASGLGLDFGLLANLSFRWATFSLGVTSLDVGQTAIAWQGTTGEPVNYVPWIQKLGFCVKLLDETLRISADIDVAFGREGLDRTHLGVEYAPIPQLAVRGGLVIGADGDRRLSAGGTVQWRGILLHYAYVPHTTLGTSHILSLHLNFPAPWDEADAE